MSVDVLPSSLSREQKGRWRDRSGTWWVPVYCANCGQLLGDVPEASTTFAFFLCEQPKNCADVWATKAGAMVEPDVVFFQTLADEMLDRFGKHLTAAELMAVLDDVNHPMHALLRERRAEIRRLNPNAVI